MPAVEEINKFINDDCNHIEDVNSTISGQSNHKF